MALSANMPFFTESLFGFVRLKTLPKSFPLRLLELAVLYMLVLGVAHLLESRMGNAFHQEWQFYAMTICLYLVLAFPGFVWRYLRRRSD
jgi:hypothetical protein